MNKQLKFVKRPIGEADASTWSLETNPIPELQEGEILVKQHYVSLDPAMRGWMNDSKSYIEPMAIGSVMRSGAVGEVVAVNKNPNFKVYTDIGHFKYYHRCLDGLEVFATEKVHGTNFRAGYVKYNAYNWWRRLLAPLLRPFGMMKYDFAYGSHRVELTRKGKRTTGFYKQNVYYMMAEQYNLKDILYPGEVIYAEIYGAGIQKGYDYGCGDNEWKMVVVDVMIDGKYIDGVAAKGFCNNRGLPFAPIVYIGTFKTFDEMNAIANPPGDKSILYPDLEKPMEGIVIKPLTETKGYMGRMVFKWINDTYWLAKGNTDFH